MATLLHLHAYQEFGSEHLMTDFIRDNTFFSESDV